MPTDSPRPWWRRATSPLKKFSDRREDTASAAQADDRALIFSLSPQRIPSGKQLRFLPRLLSASEHRIIRISTTVAILAALALVSHTLQRHIVSLPADGGTMTEGIVGVPQYLNPILARPYTADTDLSKLLFRGLFRIDEHLNVVPDLANSIKASDDRKTYTVTLKPNLHWSDGSVITANDVRYTFETVADASYQSPYQSVYKSVGVATPDAHTVVFNLPAANPQFPSTLTLGIVPSVLWHDQTPQSFPLAELNVKPVGSGPYKFQSVTKDRTGNIKGFTFVRNKLFAGARPHMEKINVKLYLDQASAVEALNSDAIDNYGNIDAADMENVLKHRQLRHFALSQLTGTFFNEKNAILKIADLRKALAMAIDREKIIRSTLGGVGRPAYGPLLSDQPGYTTDARRMTTNIDQANALLDSAGWKLDDTGGRKKGTQVLHFSLTTVDDPSYVAEANAVITAWKSIGVTVDLKTITTDRIQKDVIKPRAYDALLFGQISDIAADPYPLWHSSQQSDPGFALAIAYLKNADADLDKARATTDPAVRSAALTDFQNIVVDEVPAIILTQSEFIYAHEKSLRGFPSDRIVAPADRFNSIASWYVKTTLSWK